MAGGKIPQIPAKLIKERGVVVSPCWVGVSSWAIRRAAIANAVLFQPGVCQIALGAEQVVEVPDEKFDYLVPTGHLVEEFTREEVGTIGTTPEGNAVLFRSSRREYLLPEPLVRLLGLWTLYGRLGGDPGGPLFRGETDMHGTLLVADFMVAPLKVEDAAWRGVQKLTKLMDGARESTLEGLAKVARAHGVTGATRNADGSTTVQMGPDCTLTVPKPFAEAALEVVAEEAQAAGKGVTTTLQVNHHGDTPTVSKVEVYEPTILPAEPSEEVTRG